MSRYIYILTEGRHVLWNGGSSIHLCGMHRPTTLTGIHSSGWCTKQVPSWPSNPVFKDWLMMNTTNDHHISQDKIDHARLLINNNNNKKTHKICIVSAMQIGWVYPKMLLLPLVLLPKNHSSRSPPYPAMYLCQLQLLNMQARQTDRQRLRVTCTALPRMIW